MQGGINCHDDARVRWYFQLHQMISEGICSRAWKPHNDNSRKVRSSHFEYGGSNPGLQNQNTRTIIQCSLISRGQPPELILQGPWKEVYFSNSAEWTPNKQFCFSKSAPFRILSPYNKQWYHIGSQVVK